MNEQETNKGAAFAPYADQSFILQGKFDLEGDLKRFVVIRQPVTNGGRPQLVIYQKVAVLFENERKETEKSPDFSGPYELKSNWRMSGWRGWTERAGHFLSLRLNPPRGNGEDRAGLDQRGEPGQRDELDQRDRFDDEIPF